MNLVPYLAAECCDTFPDEAELAEHLAEHHPAAWERWYWGRYSEEVAHRRLGAIR